MTLNYKIQESMSIVKEKDEEMGRLGDKGGGGIGK